MQAIVDVHFPSIQKILVSKAMDIFYEVRDVPGLKKKPSTSELLDWLKLLLAEDMPLDVLQSRDPKKAIRSEEHTSELQSLMRNSYAVFCVKKKKKRMKMNNEQLR